MSLDGFRIDCHQTRNIGKEVLCGEQRLMKDSVLSLNEACRWCACIKHYRGESLESCGVREF